MGHYTPMRMNDPQLKRTIRIDLTNMTLKGRQTIQKSAFYMGMVITVNTLNKKQTICILAVIGRDWTGTCDGFSDVANVLFLDHKLCSICENPFSSTRVFCAFAF